MSRALRKTRLFHLHPKTNEGKAARLEALHAEYAGYVHTCMQHMLDNRRLNLRKAEKQAFFPKAKKLTSQVEKNARDHAIQIVSAWAKARYALKIKKAITTLKKEGVVSEAQAKVLYTIGKYLRDQPKGKITQEDIDLYWKILGERGGKRPEVRESLPMRLSQETARLEPAKNAVQAVLWLKVSSLTPYKGIWLPLVGNPYVSHPNQVSKGILARKTKKGLWRFEAVEKREWIVPEPKDLPEDAPRLGVDVGLNVLAATSGGELYGEDFKPKFDRAYGAVKTLRANRMRQGLKENSPRLARLESNLSGRIKTETGRIANLLVERYPDTVFVLEDLDLRGCKGQKRFAYRALCKALESKAPVEVVNPAYTSQECPSCGYISRSNRSGTKFKCRSCGRLAHADWTGASGILRRSEDNDIACKDRPNSVKATLRRRYRLRRNSRARSSQVALGFEPVPSGRSLTTEVPSGLGTGSNLAHKGTLCPRIR